MSTRTFGPQLGHLDKVLDNTNGFVRQLSEPPGLQQKHIQMWEQRHLKVANGLETTTSFALPPDLTEFLGISNGFALEWCVRVRTEEHCVGCLKVWPLDRMSLLEQPQRSDDMQAYQINELLPQQRGIDYELLVIDQPSPREAVVLVLFNRSKRTQVWFKDVSSAWFYICEGFKPYVRLLVEHLGIRNWHYVYSPRGVDPTTEFWLHLLVPGRSRISFSHGPSDKEAKSLAKIRSTLPDNKDLRFLDVQAGCLESKGRSQPKRDGAFVRGTNHQLGKGNHVRPSRNQQGGRPASAPLRTAGSRRGCRGK